MDKEPSDWILKDWGLGRTEKNSENILGGNSMSKRVALETNVTV